jgi:predicted amidohydrolase YtcJ
MSSRREFLGHLGSAAVAGWAFDRWITPDLVLYNGNVVTVDDGRPLVRAVAIAGDRVLDVGDDAAMRALAGRGTRLVDLGGRTVLPGFIDAHNHPAVAGRQHLRNVDCELPSIAAIVAALRERAGRTPEGQWVLGFKYDDTKGAEGRALTRDDLDAVSRAHPVYVAHRGGHSAYVNSRALEVAGVTERTPDPEGGRFERDAAGRLTGRALEHATDPFDRAIPNTFTAEDYRAGVKLISAMLAKAGITSVHDAYCSPRDLRAYQEARDAGELNTRVYCLVGAAHLDRMLEAGVRTGLGDEWVRVGAMKATCDGSISERTARLSEPYVGRPHDHGLIVAGEDELWPIARKAHAAGWQLGIHANGDVAIDLVLRIYERLQRELPRQDPRFRIEHCTVVTDDLVRRMKALGVIPTPFATYVYFHGEKMREYGAERLDRMFAVRSFLDAGVRAAFASDYPPGPFDPMMALQSQVTRTDSRGTTWGARQRIGIDDAIRVGTLHGAYASFEERRKGSITPGKLADLVVLGRDPRREDPATLIGIPVERTMVGGRWVYES